MAMSKMQEFALRKAGADEMADLAREMEALSATRPDIQKAGDAFTALADKSPMTVLKLNDQLEKDPKLAGNIKTLLDKNPAAFEAALPAIFSQPDRASELITQAANPTAPKPAAAPAAVLATPQSHPYVMKPVTEPEPEPEHQVVRHQRPAAPAAAPVAAAATGFDAKWAKLQEAEGFKDLMDRVENNPRLAEMFAGLMSQEGTEQEREAALDDVLAKLKDNPKMLKNMAKTIDDHPGVVTSMADTFVNDPKTGMMVLASYSEMRQSPWMGLISGLFAKMGFGGFGAGMGGGGFPGFGGGIGGLIDKIVVSVMGMVGGIMGESKDIMVAADNTNGKLAAAALTATNAKPETVTTIDPVGQPEAVSMDEWMSRHKANQAAVQVAGTAVAAPAAQV